MTKDPAIAEHFDAELRELAVKGTKFRETFVGIRPVPKEVGKDTAEGRVDFMIWQALQNSSTRRRRGMTYRVHGLRSGGWRSLSELARGLRS